MQYGQVGDVASGTTVGVFGAMLSLATDEDLAHGSGGIGIEDIFYEGETVDFEFLDGLFLLVHGIVLRFDSSIWGIPRADLSKKSYVGGSLFIGVFLLRY